MNNHQSIKDNWNAQLYDQNHSFVSSFGNNLIELLAPKQDEKILDLGCGTGDLAKRLYDDGVDIVGVDSSNNMIKSARSKYPEIQFIVQDALELSFNAEFDAVFSNATLHWIKEQEQALKSIYQSLIPGGRFIAEFGGKGNVQLITDEIIHQFKVTGIEYNMEKFPWYFPSIGEYTSLMEDIGFKVILAQHFNRPTILDGENGLKNWIEMFGSQIFVMTEEDKKDYLIKKVEENLRGILYKDGNWIADYKRIRVVAIKE